MADVEPGQRSVCGTVLPVTGTDLVVWREGRALLNGVTVSIAREPGITVLIGPNGAGKSLLIRCLAGLVPPDTGKVRWAGRPPDEARRGQVGFVLQRPVMLRRSALENVSYALRIAGQSPSEAVAAAAIELERAGLAAIAATRAHKLSGGEQQRVALSRALIMKPQVIFLDEPSANLDPASTAAIEARLREVVAKGITALLVTQDLKQARRLATTIVMMHQGRILEYRPAAEFFAAPQSEAAQRFLDGALLLD